MACISPAASACTLSRERSVHSSRDSSYGLCTSPRMSLLPVAPRIYFGAARLCSGAQEWLALLSTQYSATPVCVLCAAAGTALWHPECRIKTACLEPAEAQSPACQLVNLTDRFEQHDDSSAAAGLLHSVPESKVCTTTARLAITKEDYQARYLLLHSAGEAGCWGSALRRAWPPARLLCRKQRTSAMMTAPSGANQIDRSLPS